MATDGKGAPESSERPRNAYTGECPHCGRYGPVRLYDAETTSKILGGVVSANWLMEHVNEIPCTRLGRFIGWSDDNITQLLAENRFDSYGRRKASGRKPK